MKCNKCKHLLLYMNWVTFWCTSSILLLYCNCIFPCTLHLDQIWLRLYDFCTYFNVKMSTDCLFVKAESTAGHVLTVPSMSHQRSGHPRLSDDAMEILHGGKLFLKGGDRPELCCWRCRKGSRYNRHQREELGRKEVENRGGDGKVSGRCTKTFRHWCNNLWSYRWLHRLAPQMSLTDFEWMS